MTSPTRPPSISYVKLLREIRNRINEEIADMTIDERLRWHESQDYGGDPTLEALAARAKPPKPSSPRKPTEQDE